MQVISLNTRWGIKMKLVNDMWFRGGKKHIESCLIYWAWKRCWESVFLLIFCCYCALKSIVLGWGEWYWVYVHPFKIYPSSAPQPDSMLLSERLPCWTNSPGRVGWALLPPIPLPSFFLALHLPNHLGLPCASFLCSCFCPVSVCPLQRPLPLDSPSFYESSSN